MMQAHVSVRQWPSDDFVPTAHLGGTSNQMCVVSISAGTARQYAAAFTEAARLLDEATASREAGP